MTASRKFFIAKDHPLTTYQIDIILLGDIVNFEHRKMFVLKFFSRCKNSWQMEQYA